MMNVREKLKLYANTVNQIRQFFDERNVLEVSTPILGLCTTPCPQTQSLETTVTTPDGRAKRFLQTSPEFPMKKLLAQGSACIYQLGKAFRDEELGRLHQNEFTMLEWYRIGFDYHQLMDEVIELILLFVSVQNVQRITYQDLFKEHCDFDPLDCELEFLQSFDAQMPRYDNIDACLQYIFCEHIEAKLKGLVLVYDFPISQAALSKQSKDDRRVACRFEAYVNGIELANGFDELDDSIVQRERFEADNLIRTREGLSTIPIDDEFIAAVGQLPQCSGVALGVDRLMLLSNGLNDLNELTV